MTSRYCKVCTDWHELDEPWPLACSGHFAPKTGSIQIIKDIDPYKAVAIDKTSGKRPHIGSRREHREFLKRNGLHEVGTDPIRERKIDYGDIHPREIVQTIEKLRSERGR